MRRVLLTALVMLLAGALAAPASGYLDHTNSYVDLRTPEDALDRTLAVPLEAWPGIMTVAGDVDGDRRDDLVYGAPRWGDTPGAATVFLAPASAGPGSTRIPGLRLTGAGLWSVTRAGDLDGDGRDDLAVSTDSGVRVVFGRSDGVVDVDRPGPDTLELRFESGDRASSVAAAGDADGDGRDDLVVSSYDRTALVFTPPSPRGSSVEIGPDNAAVLTPAQDLVENVAVLDSPRRDRREVVMSQRQADGSMHLVGVPLPTAPGPVDLDRAVAWRLTGIWFSIQQLDAAGDHDADGRQDMVVHRGDGFASIVFSPGRGTSGDIAVAPGIPSVPHGAVHAGDQDGDGAPDLARGTLMFTQPGAPYEAWREQHLGASTLGVVRDLDGDGLPEIVTVDRPETRVAPGDPSAVITTWSSRGLARVRTTPPPPVPPSPDWLVPLLHCQREIGPTCTVEQALARLAKRASPWPTDPGLASTPEYVAGSVRVRVRALRGTTVAGVPETSGWPAGSPVVPLPEVRSAASTQQPWTELSIPLPPEQRATIEQDGRMRVRIAVTVTTPLGHEREDALSFVVVAPRTAPASARMRTLKGSFGVQRLLGGPLSELLTGASGDDVLRGGAGVDRLEGGTGNDRLYGDADADVLEGGDGDDRLRGGPGNDDLIEARFGDDTLWGEDGDDVLHGLRGHDVLHGGPGDDVLRGGSGPDEVDCGPGEDVVFVNFGAEREDLRGCEHVYDEPGVIHVPCRDGGTPGPETVLGTEGKDVCDGFGGDDDVEGRGGDDVLRGGAGKDRIFGRFGADRLHGGEGKDELEGGRGRDRLDGGAGDDQLNGGYDPDVVRGGSGDDRIIARGGGADDVDCGPGRRDVAVVDSADRVRGCERVERSGVRRR